MGNRAVILPPPRTGCRTEIDIAAIEKIFGRPLHLQYLLANFDTDVIHMMPTIEIFDEMHPNDDDPRDNNNSNNIDSIQGTNEVRPYCSWFPEVDKLFKVVLTYLIVFCLIGFLFTLLP